MPKKLSFQLTEDGLREIVEAIKHDRRPEVRQRAMGLRLLHKGKAAKEWLQALKKAPKRARSTYSLWTKAR